MLVVTAVVIAFLVKTLLAQAFYIPSASMAPQLQVGDRVVVSKLAYRLHEPRRGDIVVFDVPGPIQTGRDSPPLQRLLKSLLESVGLAAPSTDEYIKRVVALPGETVEGRHGRVYVDGKELVEPYLPQGPTTRDFEPVVLGEDELWVMGDNRESSSDSRTFGPIRTDSVVGRAFARIWPVTKSSFL